MNRIPNVEGKIKLDLYQSGKKKDTAWSFFVSCKNVGFVNSDLEKNVGPWLDFNDRHYLVNTTYLTHEEIQQLQDQHKTRGWGDSRQEEIYSSNFRVPVFHILSKVLPKINDVGYFSNSNYKLLWKCDDPKMDIIVRDAIEQAISDINKQFSTGYYVEFEEIKIKAPQVTQLPNITQDKFGNDIEMGDIVASSPIDNTGVLVGQIVGMSKTQVFLDSGRRPFYENVMVIKKYNGKPVFFGY